MRFTHIYGLAATTIVLCAATGITGLGAGLARAGVQDEPRKQNEKSEKSEKGQDKPPVRPGKDRWLVKTAADPDAAGIDPKAVQTTIADLLKLPRPTEMPLQETPAAFQNKRVGPVEKTVYTVEADIVECQLMQDGDYRVVLRDAAGETIVMEMPDPAFVDNKSPYFYAIKSAREKFSSRTKPEREKKAVVGHAKITGIGFFGRAYNKTTPPKGNLIQLHPVLDFGWQETASWEFRERAEAAKRAKASVEPAPSGERKPS